MQICLRTYSLFKYYFDYIQNKILCVYSSYTLTHTPEISTKLKQNQLKHLF